MNWTLNLQVILIVFLQIVLSVASGLGTYLYNSEDVNKKRIAGDSDSMIIVMESLKWFIQFK